MFRVGEEVSKAVNWQEEPVYGRIIEIDPHAPHGRCYRVLVSGWQPLAGSVLRFSGLHMTGIGT